MITVTNILIVLGILMVVFGYIKSKTWASKTRLTIVLATLAASIFLVNFTIKYGISLEINAPFLSQIGMMALIIMTYCLASLTQICFCAWKKDGFRNLQSMKYGSGILDGLKEGIRGGTLASIICGGPITIGFISILMFGTVNGICLGIIWGLIVASVVGFILQQMIIPEELRKMDLAKLPCITLSQYSQ